MKTYPFRYVFYITLLCWKDTYFLYKNDDFLEILVVFKLSSFIIHAFAFVIVIHCISTESHWFNKLLFIFWRKHLIKPEKAKPLKELFSFPQHAIEGKRPTIYNSYQLYCIKPLWASVQSLAESLWQILNGAGDTTFAGKFSLIT